MCAQHNCHDDDDDMGDYTAEYVGLAIDPVRQKLYYADAASYSGKVGEMSTDGTDHRVLFGDGSSKPRALVLDNDNR